MVDNTKDEQTPLSDVKFDAEGVTALLILLANIANQGTAGSTAGTAGNTNQMGAGANVSETSVKAQTDINTEESLSAYTGLAVNDATTHVARVHNMSEQILQNAITQSNAIVTDSIGHKHKRTTDQDVVSDFLHFQGLRNESIATDREWNIDEQTAGVESLYATLAAANVAIVNALAAMKPEAE